MNDRLRTRWRGLGAAAWLGLLCVLWGAAAAVLAQGSAQRAIALSAGQDVLALDGSAEYWLDDSGSTSVADLAAAEGRAAAGSATSAPTPTWLPYRAGLVLQIDRKKLWVRFTVDASAAAGPWWVDLPQPWLDRVGLYVQAADGTWLERKAGDAVPHSQWSHVSRTPRLQLPLTSGVHTYYVSVVHDRAAYPMRMSLQSQAYVDGISVYEQLFFGVCIGVGVLVVLLAAGLAFGWRDAALAYFGVYFLFTMGWIMTRMGVNSLLLWPEQPLLNAFLGRLLPLAAIAAGLAFMHRVVRRDQHMPRIELPLLGLAALAFLLGLWEAIWPSMRGFVVAQLAGLVFGGVLVVLFALSLWRGSTHTRLVCAAMLPMVAASLFVVMRNAGVQSSGYEIGQFAAIGGLALQTPVLLLALIRNGQALREQRVHAGNLDRVDAVTGLSTRGVLEFNLRGALARAEQSGQGFMLMLVHLSNHREIGEKWSAAVASQALASVAGSLHELKRSIDTAAVVDGESLALLIDATGSAKHAAPGANAATSLLVRALQPSKVLPPGLKLQLRITLAHLPEPMVGVVVGDEPADCLTWMRAEADAAALRAAPPIQRLNF